VTTLHVGALRLLKARLQPCDRVIGELEVLVAAQPGREHPAGQLMLALYRCGRQDDALDVYARTREYLSGELGLEPEAALRTFRPRSRHTLRR
jgi:DNA-binding SARP family transcriptional activator